MLGLKLDLKFFKIIEIKIYIIELKNKKKPQTNSKKRA